MEVDTEEEKKEEEQMPKSQYPDIVWVPEVSEFIETIPPESSLRQKWEFERFLAKDGWDEA